MQELDFIKDLVIVFALGLAVVTLLGRPRVPSIAGYVAPTARAIRSTVNSTTTDVGSQA